MSNSLERTVLVLGVLVAILIWAATAFHWIELPWWFLLYGAESLLAAIAIGADKRAAGRGKRRMSELGLHLLELLGGFPGSFLAQRLFRHKTYKPSYRVVFWLIVLLHVAAWVWYLSIP